jgi:tRNA (guanine37-N1)-methyltransferase
MKVNVFCAIPEILASPMDFGVLGRAREKGALTVRTYDLHHLGGEPHGKIDDYPYGGGPGMVLRVDVVATAMEAVFGGDAADVKNRMPVVLLTPQGRKFDQGRARELASEPELTVICGRYEGVDERIRERLAGEELSIGDYVLSGGEVAAVAVLEAVARLLPGVLGNLKSVAEESFSGRMLEYPQYTRPASYRGWEVPGVLLSGDHRRIAEWRGERSVERTRERRPDLLKKNGE